MSYIVDDSKGCGKRVQVAVRDRLGDTDAFPSRYCGSLHTKVVVMHLWQAESTGLGDKQDMRDDGKRGNSDLFILHLHFFMHKSWKSIKF